MFQKRPADAAGKQFKSKLRATQISMAKYGPMGCSLARKVHSYGNSQECLVLEQTKH